MSFLANDDCSTRTKTTASWRDWSPPAIRRYHEHANRLRAGLINQVDRSGEMTRAELANGFLEAKRRKRANGEIHTTTFVEHLRDCESMVRHFGHHCEATTITRTILRSVVSFRRGV